MENIKHKSERKEKISTEIKRDRDKDITSGFIEVRLTTCIRHSSRISSTEFD